VSIGSTILAAARANPLCHFASAAKPMVVQKVSVADGVKVANLMTDPIDARVA